MLKVLVCGSRSWTDLKRISKRISLLPKDSLVIQGGASGADIMARHAAKLYGLHYAEVPALWENGRGAGPTRNLVMLDLEPDLVIAFQKGNSRGTQHTIDHARKRGINVEVHRD